jgi:hypothetical protein
VAGVASIDIRAIVARAAEIFCTALMAQV